MTKKQRLNKLDKALAEIDIEGDISSKYICPILIGLDLCTHDFADLFKPEGLHMNEAWFGRWYDQDNQNARFIALCLYKEMIKTGDA